VGRSASAGARHERTARARRERSAYGAEIEVEHRVERRGVAPQPTAKCGTLPAVNEPVRHLARVRLCRHVACALRLLEACCQALGDLREAPVDLLPEYVVHARQFLSEASEQAAEIAFAAIRLAGRLEEAAHPLERRMRAIAEARVEPRVDRAHVLVDDLQREVFLVAEVVIKRPFRDVGRRQDRGDAEVVVAVLQQHGHAGVEKALLGRVRRPVVGNDGARLILSRARAFRMRATSNHVVSPSPSRSCAR